MMKYGVKLWSSNSDMYVQLASSYTKGEIDYLELLYVPGQETGLEILKDCGIPVVTHAPTYNQDVCFSDGNAEKNNEIIRKVFDFMNSIRSEELIIHPGFGTVDGFETFLGEHQDDRIVIENMPKRGLAGTTCIGFTPEAISRFLGKGSFGFCLDIGHAIKSAVNQALEPYDYLKRFMELEPGMVHVCDGNLENDVDEHLALGDGNFDLGLVKSILEQENIEKITFEVPKKDGIENDLKSMRYFKTVC